MFYFGQLEKSTKTMPLRIVSRIFKIANDSNSLLINGPVSRRALCGCQQSYYSTKLTNVTSVIDPETGETKKVRTTIIPKITLIKNGDDLSITTLEEAQKLSKRRDLKLVKIVDLDTKTQRPVYKLMTGSEYHAEDLKQRELKKKEKLKGGIKGEKVLLLGHNISEHDLQTDVKKILKWVMKSYEVRLVINGDSNNMEKAEKVYSLLENSLKADVRFLQKRQKGSDIKCQIMPQKQNKHDEDKQL